MTDKGMHIVRHMADGGTIGSCNTLEIDMQDVLMNLLQPGQPMLMNANKDTLVLCNLHQIVDDHRPRQYQITRDNSGLQTHVHRCKFPAGIQATPTP
jgi:hypothetical protein